MLRWDMKRFRAPRNLTAIVLHTFLICDLANFRAINSLIKQLTKLYVVGYPVLRLRYQIMSWIVDIEICRLMIISKRPVFCHVITSLPIFD